MRILVENNETGVKKEFMLPDGLPPKEVARIKEYLSNGGKAKRDFSISSRQSNKAYIPADTDVTLVANGIGESEEWVKQNLHFVKMVASDTTVDLQWDKFSESVIRALGVQYAEDWENGIAGGRTMCIMHVRGQIVGRTYRYEVVDATDAEGNLIMDENNTGVKQLIVYAYVRMSAMYNGEPFVNLLKDASFCKVSISAWISNWQYIPSDQSNWIPPGETDTSGYFFYPDGSAVETIELSFVDMGANPNAHVMKNKIATVTVIDETTAPTPTPPVETEKTEKETKEVKDEVKDLQLNINIAEYNLMKEFWDSTPDAIRKAALKWVAVTLKNHGDGKEFHAPDFCATKFKNMDTRLGSQIERIKELEAKVAELESTVSDNAEKAIGFDLDAKEWEKTKVQKEAAISELTAKLLAVEKELNIEREVYSDKFVSLSAQIDGVTNDADSIEALKVIAKSLSIADLRTKSAALSVQLISKKTSTKIEIPAETVSRKRF